MLYLDTAVNKVFVTTVSLSRAYKATGSRQQPTSFSWKQVCGLCPYLAVKHKLPPSRVWRRHRVVYRWGIPLPYGLI